uniref:Uncharacterized protein n=1 Tax=Arundo donax TaxID=35708 RepID=A0A0A9AZY6_ARUDO
MYGVVTSQECDVKIKLWFANPHLLMYGEWSPKPLVVGRNEDCFVHCLMIHNFSTTFFGPVIFSQ